MQHSYLMHEIQSLGIDVLTDYLRTSRATAGASCETVLLSGEDFENCIVDLALAREVESAAHIAGFSAVEWHVVVRPRDATCDSLYAEMSKHGVVLDRAVMQQAAERRGCFYASTAAFNYIFVLDYPRLAPRFAKAIAGKIVDYSMDAFTRHHQMPLPPFARRRSSTPITPMRVSLRGGLKETIFCQPLGQRS
ncbi:MAG: hypothetical protein MUF74_09850 [Cypionkella sp.]|nr:hypothetical protein [Cypionkella sp.]